MRYSKLFLCTTFFLTTFSCSARLATIRSAFRAGSKAFKESLKNDLRPHAQNLRDKTAKKSLVSDMQLRIAVKDKRELERKLAAVKFDIAKYKLQKHLYGHAESVINYFGEKWFSKSPKQLIQKYMIEAGKEKR